MPRQETRRPSFFAALVVDAAELVVAFLGAGADSAALGATSRTWRDRVRHHDAWGAALARVAPLKARELQRGLAAKREAGEFSSSVDWAPHVSRYMRQGPASWVSNRPQQCQAMSHGTVPSPNSAADASTAPPSGATGGFLSRIAAAVVGFVGQSTSLMFQQRAKTRILVLGLDSAGKMSLLRKLRIGDPAAITSTIGFSVSAIEYKRTVFTSWTVGTGARVRPLWLHYTNDVDAVVFVVDANDRARLVDPHEPAGLYHARGEIEYLLDGKPGLRGVPLLVLANKQDLPGALPAEAVAERLGLELVSSVGRAAAPAAATAAAVETRPFPWCVQGTCAANGKGLFESLDWLASVLQERQG